MRVSSEGAGAGSEGGLGGNGTFVGVRSGERGGGVTGCFTDTGTGPGEGVGSGGGRVAGCPCVGGNVRGCVGTRGGGVSSRGGDAGGVGGAGTTRCTGAVAAGSEGRVEGVCTVSVGRLLKTFVDG